MPKAIKLGSALTSFLLLFSGATFPQTYSDILLYQKDAAAARDLFRRQVAGAGDVNGDGKADFIAGPPATPLMTLTDLALAQLV